MEQAPFKIGIVGSRRRDTPEDYYKLYDKVMRTIVYLDVCEPVMLISGGCKTGADKWAEEIAEDKRIPIIVFNPDFEKHGSPNAYFVRNDQIAKESDILIALVSEDRTGGTEDTIKKFRKHHPTNNIIIL